MTGAPPRFFSELLESDAARLKPRNMMTPQEISDTKIVVQQTNVLVLAAEELPLDSDRLSRLLALHGLVTGGFDLAGQSFAGMTLRGVEASEALARSLRKRLGPIGQRATNVTVANLIRGYVLNQWRGRTAQNLTTPDFNDLEHAVVNWLAAQSQTRRHFVPCRLFVHRLNSFSVGPVQFYHLSDLPTPNMAGTRKEFWPEPVKSTWKQKLQDAIAIMRDRSPSPKAIGGNTPGGFHYADLVRLCQERHAFWIAEVEVPGREQTQSIVTADFAANIAMAALYVALPGDDLRAISRATERSPSVWRFDAWTSDQSHGSNFSNGEPGRTLAPEIIEDGLKQQAALLQSMGRRLDSYLTGQGGAPGLNESWCNAAYWFHEALLEPVEAVAVAQLETALEVLFSTAATKISTSRIVEALSALLGIEELDPIAPNSPVTVRNFVESVVTARSRVLHGTWPTLSTELPLSVRIADVEALARTLLIAMSLQLDAYVAAGRQENDTKLFLTWVKSQRASSSTP